MIKSINKKFVVILAAVWGVSLLAGAVSPAVERYLKQRELPPGAVEYQTLKDRYDAKAFKEVIAQGQQAINGNRQGQFGPQILLLCWHASEVINSPADRTAIQDAFCKRYSKEPLAAELHFAIAMHDIRMADGRSAARELSLITTDFPQASVRPFAQSLLDGESTMQ